MLYTLYKHSVEISEDLTHLGLLPTKNNDSANIIVKTGYYNKKNQNFLDNQFSLTPDYGFYYRENIGLFEFKYGKVIEAHSEGKIDASFIQTLLNFPFACIFAQNGFLPIHASAVRFRGKTILFPGISKQGKSSLVASLIKNGGKLITEDIALFRFANNEAEIVPSYPLIKLSDEANKAISFSTEDPFKLMKSELNRSLYKIDKQNFYDEESKIDVVIFPEWSSINELKPIPHKKSIIKIISSNFFTSEIPTLEINNLKNNLSVIKNSKCYEYKRKQDINKLINFSKEIERLLI